MSRRGEYEDVIRREVESWPGVTVAFGTRTKHAIATFTFEGRSRFTMSPMSPSDSRFGIHNKIGDVRRTLRELGATRTEIGHSGHKRHRRHIDRPVSLPTRERGRADTFDPWRTPLAELRERIAA